jgi:hypothetical protein
MITRYPLAAQPVLLGLDLAGPPPAAGDPTSRVGGRGPATRAHSG